MSNTFHPPHPQISHLELIYHISQSLAGDSQPLDVCSAHHPTEPVRYSVSLLGYGFYGDVLAESERHRWMGPLRYDFSGAAHAFNKPRSQCNNEIINGSPRQQIPHRPELTKCIVQKPTAVINVEPWYVIYLLIKCTLKSPDPFVPHLGRSFLSLFFLCLTCGPWACIKVYKCYTSCKSSSFPCLPQVPWFTWVVEAMQA